MNWIDLIVALILIVAVWNGWRQGFVVQVCGLAGLVVAIWLAARYGAAVGGWLRLDEDVAAPGGFVAVLVGVIVAAAILARAVRKLFRFAGFGIPDIVLGVAVSVLKYVLLLGALFSAFDRLNRDYTLVGPQTIETSIAYRPVIRISGMVYPFLEWVGDRVPLRGEPEQDPGRPQDAGEQQLPDRAEAARSMQSV